MGNVEPDKKCTFKLWIGVDGVLMEAWKQGEVQRYYLTSLEAMRLSEGLEVLARKQAKQYGDGGVER